MIFHDFLGFSWIFHDFLIFSLICLCNVWIGLVLNLLASHLIFDGIYTLKSLRMALFDFFCLAPSSKMEWTSNCGNEWWEGRTSIQIASEQIRQVEGALRSRTAGAGNAGRHTRPHQVPWFLTLIGQENENEWAITNIITKWYIAVSSKLVNHFVNQKEMIWIDLKDAVDFVYWIFLTSFIKFLDTTDFDLFWYILMIHDYSLLICKRWNLDRFGRLVLRQKIRVCIGLIEVWKRHPVQNPQCSQSRFRNWIGNDGVERSFQTKAVQRGGRNQLCSGLASGGSGAFRIGGESKKKIKKQFRKSKNIYRMMLQPMESYEKSVPICIIHILSFLYILFSDVSIVFYCCLFRIRCYWFNVQGLYLDIECL